jgi:hypothetical protein
MNESLEQKELQARLDRIKKDLLILFSEENVADFISDELGLNKSVFITSLMNSFEESLQSIPKEFEIEIFSKRLPEGKSQLSGQLAIIFKIVGNKIHKRFGNSDSYNDLSDRFDTIRNGELQAGSFSILLNKEVSGLNNFLTTTIVGFSLSSEEQAKERFGDDYDSFLPTPLRRKNGAEFSYAKLLVNSTVLMTKDICNKKGFQPVITSTTTSRGKEGGRSLLQKMNFVNVEKYKEYLDQSLIVKGLNGIENISAIKNGDASNMIKVPEL